MTVHRLAVRIAVTLRANNMTDAVYLLVLGQRVDRGLQVIRMLDVLQEVLSKR